jgi:hypothetical protein
MAPALTIDGEFNRRRFRSFGTWRTTILVRGVRPGFETRKKLAGDNSFPPQTISDAVVL